MIDPAPGTLRLRGAVRVLLAGGLLGAAAAAGGCARVPPQPPPFPGAQRVEKVAVSGAERMGASEVRQHIGTSAGAWFDPAVWQNDLQRIVRFYQQNGYYAASIVQHDVISDGDRVVPRVTVHEGEPSYLAELVLRGLDALPAGVRQAVFGAVSLRRGDVFRESAWDASKAAMLEALHASGYAAAELATEARVDPSDGRARALIEVRAGKRFRFGSIRLASAPPHDVSAAEIIAEASAAIDPDGWYDPSALADVQRRVFEMGAFDSVTVTAATPEVERGRVPVVIAVTPGPTFTLRSGFGLGLAPARSEVHALGGLVIRRFAGTRTLRIDARAGYAVVPDVVSIATQSTVVPTRTGPIATFVADVDQPRVFGSPRAQLFGSVAGDLGLGEAYRSVTARPRVGLAWSIARPLEAELSYGFRADHLFDTPLLSAETVPTSAFGCAAPCTLSFVQALVRWDTTAPSHPGSGERALLRVRSAGGPLGAHYDLVDVRGELGLDRRWGEHQGNHVGFRLEARTVFSTGSHPVPVTARLFGGGSEMHGFGPQHLAPILLVPLSHGGVAALPSGGQGLLEGSLRIDREVSGNLSIGAFLDFGAVSIQAFDPGRLLGNLLFATGVGLAYQTPLGPARLDLGYRLPIGPPLPVTTLPGAPPASISPIGCFGIGRGQRAGAPESPCLVHISIGEAM